MPEWLKLEQLAAAAIYSFLGVVMFGFAFWLIDKLTPSINLKKELLEDENVALGIVIAGCSIALGIVIAAAIQG